jgi:hypothetical protein
MIIIPTILKNDFKVTKIAVPLIVSSLSVQLNQSPVERGYFTTQLSGLWIVSLVERWVSTPKNIWVKMYFLKPFKNNIMAKIATLANNNISTQEDFLKFVASLSATNSKKSRTAVRTTVGDIPSLDISKLRDVEEDIYLSNANIEINLKGDVGVFSVALLSRRFKRTGFAGRYINLSIPASVNPQEKDKLIDRIGLCVKSEFAEEVKTLIKNGASITMAEAKKYGLIDQEVDLSKRRGAKSTTAVVASDDKPVSENPMTTS